MDQVVVASKAKLLRQLQCEICLESVKDARLCPRCSRFYCNKCIHSWISRSKTCPNCRTVLGHKALINGYSINVMQETIKELVSSLDRLDVRETPDNAFCGRHGKLQLNLFCYGCKINICSKCWFSEHHADHKERVVPLDEAFEDYRKKLKLALAWVDEQIQLIDRGLSNPLLLSCDRERFVKLREKSVALVTGEASPVTLMDILKIEGTITELHSKPLQSETEAIQMERDREFMPEPTVVVTLFRSNGTSAESWNATYNSYDWSDCTYDSLGRREIRWRFMIPPTDQESLFLIMTDGKPSKYSVTFDTELEQVHWIELHKPVLIGHLDKDMQQVIVQIRLTYTDRIEQLENVLASERKECQVLCLFILSFPFVCASYAEWLLTRR